MNSPLISVIIPVYNVELYLKQCIDSVINQTYKNLEIILVDDGSPDNCPQICDDYAKQVNRIVVIHQKNQGLSAARNTGLDVCKGDFIYFLDSDDFIRENAIENLMNALTENPDCAIAISYFTAYENQMEKIYRSDWLFDKPRLIKSQEFANRLVLEKSNHAACAKLYKKEIFEKIRFQMGKKNEDSLLNVDLVPIIEQYKYSCIEIPDYSYFYRIREEGICRNLNEIFDFHIIENLDYAIMKFQNREELVAALINKKFMITASLLERVYENGINVNLYSKCINIIKGIKNNDVKKTVPKKVYFYFLFLKYVPSIYLLYKRCRRSLFI
jgi:glycosyltransferase involved in cell wall biosynthesis